MSIRDRIWHFCYRHWYDNRAAGNKNRERFWGFVNDLVVMILWPKRARHYREVK